MLLARHREGEPWGEGPQQLLEGAPDGQCATETEHLLEAWYA